MSRVLPDSWPLPSLDKHTRPFFTSGKIVIQSCDQCNRVQHPPEDICYGCQSSEFAFIEHRPIGTVYSHTEITHAIHPLLEDVVPYSVVLISLEDAPELRIIGNIVNLHPDQIRIGMKVEAVWEKIRTEESEDVFLLPQWHVTNDTSDDTHRS